MEEYCPLCQKLGKKNKIELMQINFNDSIFMCQSEVCPWPFGYKDIEIIPRNYKILTKPKKKTVKNKNPIRISSELQLYTPPVTPDENKSSDISNMTIVNSQKYSAAVNTVNSQKIIKIESGKKQSLSSIFDIDESPSAPVLVKKLNNVESKNCDIDKYLNEYNNLVHKVKSSKNGIQIKEIKRQNLDIKKPVNGKKIFVFKQQSNKSEELLNVPLKNDLACLITENNSLPKNNDILTNEQNIIDNDNNTILEFNSNTLELNSIVGNNLNSNDNCASIESLPCTLPLDSTDIIPTENLNNDVINNYPAANLDIGDLTFEECLQSDICQNDNIEFDDWLNSLL